MHLKNVFFSSLLLVIGCHHEEHFVPDLATDLAQQSDLDSSKRPATDHPAFPLLTNMHGTIISHMKAYLVVWSDDLALGEQAQTFMQWMLQSEYWTDSLGEYGIESGTFEQLITLSGAPPSNLDDTMIQAQVSQLVTDGKVAASDDAVVFFIIPSSTRVSYGTNVGCTDFGGYHSETATNHMSYGVILQCSNSGTQSGDAAAFDRITQRLSHEMSEAATDPRPDSSLAWSNKETGLEISDLCELFTADVTATISGTQDMSADGGVQDVTYRVARNYSNRAALLGNEDPCRPLIGSGPYFGVALDPLVIEIGRGENNEGKFTAQIKPYAFGNVGSISWEIEHHGSGITISPDHGTSSAGDTVDIHIEVDSSTPSSSELFYVIGHAQTGSYSSWTGILAY
jgi:hypothetical protein